MHIFTVKCSQPPKLVLSYKMKLYDNNSQAAPSTQKYSFPLKGDKGQFIRESEMSGHDPEHGFRFPDTMLHCGSGFLRFYSFQNKGSHISHSKARV